MDTSLSFPTPRSTGSCAFSKHFGDRKHFVCGKSLKCHFNFFCLDDFDKSAFNFNPPGNFALDVSQQSSQPDSVRDILFKDLQRVRGREAQSGYVEFN